MIKELLKLSVKSDVAAWNQVEAQLIPHIASLSNADLGQVVVSFGSAKQGSDNLWRALDQTTNEKLDSLKENDLYNVVLGFLKTSYAPSKELGAKLTEAIKVIENIAREHVAAKDPQYRQKMLDELQSRVKLPFGPGAVKTTVEGNRLRKEFRTGIIFYKKKYETPQQTEGEKRAQEALRPRVEAIKARLQAASNRVPDIS